ILGSQATVRTTGLLSTINITSPALSPLTILLPAGSSATMQTGGGSFAFNSDGFAVAGSITISPALGQQLSFLDSDPSGANATTLNLNPVNGGPVVTNTTNTSTTVGSGVELASGAQVVVNANNGTLVNNGTITSSAPRPSANVADFYNTNVLIDSLNGPLTLDGNNSGRFAVTGMRFSTNSQFGTFGPIVNFNTLSGTEPVNIKASFIVDLGSIGVLGIGAQSINFGSGVALKVTGGSTSPQLTTVANVY